MPLYIVNTIHVTRGFIEGCLACILNLWHIKQDQQFVVNVKILTLSKNLTEGSKCKNISTLRARGLPLFLNMPPSSEPGGSTAFCFFLKNTLRVFNEFIKLLQETPDPKEIARQKSKDKYLSIVYTSTLTMMKINDIVIIPDDNFCL